MNYNATLMFLLCLAGCQTSTVETVRRSSGTDSFIVGDAQSSAWVSDTFTGRHSRTLDPDGLSFTVTQSAAEGGLDVGLSRADFLPRPVADIPADLIFCSSYHIELSGAGRWWAGPKISVNWQGAEATSDNGDDWYENYIVEIASTSPEGLHQIFTGDYFRADVLPEMTVAGSTYRNYKIRFQDWWQFWSVRQTYRDSGSLPLAPLLDSWSRAGLPQDRQFDGVKANLETYGPINGTGRLRMNIATTEPCRL